MDHRKPRVFISHAAEDQALAHSLIGTLTHNGADAFLLPDSLRPGFDFHEEIERLVRDADLCLLLVSPAYLASEWLRVVSEAICEEAQGMGKPIVALLTGGTQHSDFPHFLKQVQSFELPEKEGRPRALLETLRSVLRPPQAPELPTLILPAPVAWPRSASGVFSAITAFLTDLFNPVAILGLPGDFWHWLSRIRVVKSTTAVPPDALVEDVHFTVTAPSTFVPGRHAELIVWAHLAQQQRLVLRRAMSMLGIAAIRQLLFRSTGPFPIERGSTLSLQLEIEGLDLPRSHNHITWTGAVGNAGFVVSVPEGAAEGTRAAVCFVRLNSMEVGRIEFVVQVGPARGKRVNVPAAYMAHRTAFASYASEDRNTVLAAIYGMKKQSPNLDVFVDVMSLRAGDDWETRITEKIRKADVFYLFWCSHACRSEWVNKEWRLAYKLKGASFIDPLPLEEPDLAPTPEELVRKHFYDPMAAFLKHPKDSGERPITAAPPRQ